MINAFISVWMLTNWNSNIFPGLLGPVKFFVLERGTYLLQAISQRMYECSLLLYYNLIVAIPTHLTGILNASFQGDMYTRNNKYTPFWFLILFLKKVFRFFWQYRVKLFLKILRKFIVSQFGHMTCERTNNVMMVGNAPCAICSWLLRATKSRDTKLPSVANLSASIYCKTKQFMCFIHNKKYHPRFVYNQHTRCIFDNYILKI